MHSAEEKSSDKLTALRATGSPNAQLGYRWSDISNGCAHGVRTCRLPEQIRKSDLLFLCNVGVTCMILAFGLGGRDDTASLFGWQLRASIRADDHGELSQRDGGLLLSSFPVFSALARQLCCHSVLDWPPAMSRLVHPGEATSAAMSTATPISGKLNRASGTKHMAMAQQRSAAYQKLHHFAS